MRDTKPPFLPGDPVWFFKSDTSGWARMRKIAAVVVQKCRKSHRFQIKIKDSSGEWVIRYAEPEVLERRAIDPHSTDD